MLKINLNLTFSVFLPINPKPLKRLLYIPVVLCLLILPGELKGATNDAGTTADKNDTKSVDPGASVATETGETPVQAVEEAPASMINGGMYLNQRQDSVNLNSLCKFNFIFYFIYKYKYDEEQSGGEFLDFEF